jgi:hypothetical protein
LVPSQYDELKDLISHNRTKSKTKKQINKYLFKKMAMFMHIIDNLCTSSVEEDMHNKNRAHTGVGMNYFSDTNDGTSFDDKYNDNKQAKKRLRRQVGGAAAVGGIVGTLVAGPVIGLVTAGGAAALASTQKKRDDDTITDTVRSIGDTAASVGDKVIQWQKDNRISEKVSNSIIDVHQWATTQYKDNETARSLHTSATTVGTNIVNWERTNRVSEKVTKGFNTALDWVADNMSDNKGHQSTISNRQ